MSCFQVKEFQTEKKSIDLKTRTLIVASEGEIKRLNRILEMKNQEMNRVSASTRLLLNSTTGS